MHFVLQRDRYVGLRVVAISQREEVVPMVSWFSRKMQDTSFLRTFQCVFRRASIGRVAISKLEWRLSRKTECDLVLFTSAKTFMLEALADSADRPSFLKRDDWTRFEIDLEGRVGFKYLTLAMRVLDLRKFRVRTAHCTICQRDKSYLC